MGNCALERMDSSREYVVRDRCLCVKYGREAEAPGWSGTSNDRLQVRIDVAPEIDAQEFEYSALNRDQRCGTPRQTKAGTVDTES